MGGFIRDIQNIKTGIYNYSKSSGRSANPSVPNNLLVSHIYLLNFHMKLMAYINYKVIIFRKIKQKNKQTKKTKQNRTFSFTSHLYFIYSWVMNNPTVTTSTYFLLNPLYKTYFILYKYYFYCKPAIHLFHPV